MAIAILPSLAAANNLGLALLLDAALAEPPLPLVVALAEPPTLGTTMHPVAELEPPLL